MAKIRLSKASLGQAEKDAVLAVIDQDYLGMGRFVQEFEQEVATFLGARHVIAVNTGTSALHLAVLAAGVRPGDEVLVPSLTYVACFQAILATGAKPIPCDALLETATIDVEDAGRRLTPRTRAIMPVHYGGRAPGLKAIHEFASAHNLRVIEDAAHAFGSFSHGRRIGSFGDLRCFSFDGIKNITCGEGGAITTEDSSAADFCRDARLLAVPRDTDNRYKGKRTWEFDVKMPGFRYHMSNLNAALGLAQLRRFEQDLAPVRKARARQYQRGLQGTPQIALFPDDFDEIVPHVYPIRVLHGKRDAVRDHLLAQDIEVGLHYYPNHLHSLFQVDGPSLPRTEQLHRELLTLPLHAGLTEVEVETVVREVHAALRDRR
jgi:dTDP-4-amino-4,6-dideoxygalactose transaminase